MSADNYYVIFREGDRYYPVMGFASDDEDGRELKLEDRHRASGGFDDPYKAFEWAEAQNPEYGVSFAESARPVEAALGEHCTCAWHMGMRDPEPGCPVDHDRAHNAMWTWAAPDGVGYLRLSTRRVACTQMLHDDTGDRGFVDLDENGAAVRVVIFGDKHEKSRETLKRRMGVSLDPA